MERFSVFVVALAAAVVLIRMIPRLPFVPEPKKEACGRPTMSPAELRFYQVLLQCIPSGYEVWAKARLSDFGELRDGHVDFLLTLGGERSPVLVVDLDELGPMGLRGSAPSVEMLTSLPILKIGIAPEYSVHWLKAEIGDALGLRMRKAA